MKYKHFKQALLFKVGSEDYQRKKYNQTNYTHILPNLTYLFNPFYVLKRSFA